MLITIKRESLLQTLESVSSGLATRENLEQSTCFVFRGGFVHTFNEQVACRAKTPLIFEGALKAKVFLDILRKLTEDDITIKTTKTKLILRGKRKRAMIRLDKEILLPIDDIEKPTEWHLLNEGFVDAVALTYPCADTNSETFMLNCIHVTPDYVEATDRVQFARITTKTGFKSEFLVKRDAIKHIVNLGFTKCSVSSKWIHFKNPYGLVFSCLKYMEDYINLDALSQQRGEPIQIPKGITESVEKAVSFLDGDPDGHHLTVEFLPDLVRVRGKGSQGYYVESKKVRYAGKSLKFRIAPDLLMEISKKYNDAEVNKRVLRAKLGHGVYMTALQRIKSKSDGN